MDRTNPTTFTTRQQEMSKRFDAHDEKLQQLWEALPSDASESSNPFIKQLSDFSALKDSYNGEEDEEHGISYNIKFCQFGLEVIPLVEAFWLLKTASILFTSTFAESIYFNKRSSRLGSGGDRCTDGASSYV
ncbi:hypothetical protein M9H77_06745 [Catharanthus roseus]|uniref:Uncharacterized protein n=1 Tax=Catharanthus roseus TaxID=4058 RepID=A0ACC0BT42_CATRO|nr:hypothetical protein M9H77_06745 [Catharanthus roseus]